MRLAHERMADQNIQQSKIGSLVRSNRNSWAESIEETIRRHSPYPITYDVGQIQTTRFTEYTYTELLSGAWIATQSREMNCRINSLLINENEAIKLDDLASNLTDKYNLNSVEHTHSGAKKVVFVPGHNMLDVSSVELITRLVHEDPDVVIKPHPLTNDETLGFLGTRFGWNRLADKMVSGNKMLLDADIVYTTSASEFSLSATALGKTVVNVSNFFNELVGAYYPISHFLFLAHKESVAKAQSVLSCLVNSNKSGLVFPWQDNLEDRIKSYYENSLSVKQQYQCFTDKSQKNAIQGEKANV
jgi:hypothetical protein